MTRQVDASSPGGTCNKEEYQKRAEANSFEVCKDNLDELLLKLDVTDSEKKRCFAALNDLISLGADAVDSYLSFPYLIIRTISNTNKDIFKKISNFFSKEDLAESKKMYWNYKSNSTRPQIYA